MALNKFMHPQNIYKDRKPDFKALAIKYPEFRQHAVQDLKGSVHLDFKKPECLRALSRALLQDDFGLDVEIPEDRLIPTVPLRLNYLLWLRDLLKKKDDTVSGIDIGTGAACVYPLLAAKQWKWKYLASESDSLNFDYSTKNVEKNGLQHRVEVVKVPEDSGLSDLLKKREDRYDFVMCNPPFFTSNLEAWGHSSSRKPDRPEASSVNTASEKESICPGGEVQFVKQMITDSLELRDRVRIFTSMLGKKSSLSPLKEELRKHGITKFGTTEFCQGRTMRWGLGWTFHEDIVFPPPPSKQVMKSKPKPPITWEFPNKMVQLPDLQYTVPFLGSKVMTVLDELKIIYEPESSGADAVHIQLAALENTWSHQRRKRRQQQREAAAEKNNEQSFEVKKAKAVDQSGSTLVEEYGVKERHTGNSTKDIKQGHEEQQASRCHETSTVPQTSCASDLNHSLSVDEVTECLFKAELRVVREGGSIQLQLVQTDGENRQLLHQLLQFFKNRFK